MGLILSQSIFVGVAVGVFDSELWLVLDNTALNGATYAMGAFAMQGLGYYVFKMFFQHGMDERLRSQDSERRRAGRYRDMQHVFDSRREDLELRMQEYQLENELRWMENNPGKAPTWAALENQEKLPQPVIPAHAAGKQETINLGVSFDNGDEDEDGERNTDGTFRKKGD
jgi:hypothetical protein